MNIIENLDEYFEKKTISVVCNGRSIIENNYSKEIDSSDIVIRMNIGAVNYKKYEKLGKKFDVLATNVYKDENFTKIYDLISSIDNNIDIITTRPLFKNQKTKCAVANEEFIHLFNIMNKRIIEIKEDVLLDNRYGNFSNYSSGLTLVLFLKDFNFKKIKIFGMDFFKTDYYYGNNSSKTGHDPKLEENIINRLINENENIVLFK